MRVFDDPNHPHYGPVRRMWIILVQLDLLSSADNLPMGQGLWDKALASRIAWGIPESTAQRSLLKHIMEHG